MQYICVEYIHDIVHVSFVARDMHNHSVTGMTSCYTPHIGPSDYMYSWALSLSLSLSPPPPPTLSFLSVQLLKVH